MYDVRIVIMMRHFDFNFIHYVAKIRQNMFLPYT
jgi:hypothetical protein